MPHPWQHLGRGGGNIKGCRLNLEPDHPVQTLVLLSLCYMNNPSSALGINYSKQSKFWAGIDHTTTTAGELKPTALIQVEATARAVGSSSQDNIVQY